MRKLLLAALFLLVPCFAQASFTCPGPYGSYTCDNYTTNFAHLQSMNPYILDAGGGDLYVRFGQTDVSTNFYANCFKNGSFDSECGVATLTNVSKSFDTRVSAVEAIFSGFSSQYVRGDGTRATLPTSTPPQAYEGTTQRTGAFPIFKSVTIASGIGAVYLTADGTSSGAALCTNGVIQDSVSVIFNDNSKSFQQSWAFTNSNKTLTITANQFTSANILSGILGQAQANSAVAKITVWCY